VANCLSGGKECLAAEKENEEKSRLIKERRCVGVYAI
jgi:hypothetical protein